MKKWWDDYGFIVIVLSCIGLAMVGVFMVSREPPPLCVTHVPNPEVITVEAQCKRGARIQVVDHVALCVCPEKP